MFSGFRSVWISWRSWRTTRKLVKTNILADMQAKDKLTSNTSEQLPGKVLDLAVGKRYEVVALEEVKDALPQKVHDDADVSAVVEAISEMYATIAVLLVVGLQCTQDPEFDLASIAVFLDGANDLDGNALVCASPVNSLDDLAEGALS